MPIQWPILPDDLGDIVSALQQLLGDNRLVGILAGDHEWSEKIDSWIKDGLPPRLHIIQSLREAYRGALLLGKVMSREELRAWFVSLHPSINFSEAPVEVVYQDPERFRRLVITTYTNIRGDICPECKVGELRYVEGFRECRSCGFSED